MAWIIQSVAIVSVFEARVGLVFVVEFIFLGMVRSIIPAGLRIMAFM